MTLNQLRRS